MARQSRTMRSRAAMPCARNACSSTGKSWRRRRATKKLLSCRATRPSGSAQLQLRRLQAASVHNDCASQAVKTP